VSRALHSLDRLGKLRLQSIDRFGSASVWLLGTLKLPLLIRHSGSFSPSITEMAPRSGVCAVAVDATSNQAARSSSFATIVVVAVVLTMKIMMMRALMVCSFYCFIVVLGCRVDVV